MTDFQNNSQMYGWDSTGLAQFYQTYLDHIAQLNGDLAGGTLLENISWNADAYTMDIDTGIGPVLQVGQEIYVIVYNNTGVTINNGQVVYPVGIFNGFDSVALATADTHENISRPIRVATMDIPTGTFGIVTRFGFVRGINTSSLSFGELWLSPDTAGAITSTKPSFPDYPVRIGGLKVQDAVNGEIFVDIRGEPEDTVVNFWNGVIRESFDFTVTSDGATVTGSLAPSNGHPDLTLMFSDGFTMFTATPAATITLTPGTATNPQTNYIYILQSTKALTVSTSGWPTTEHIRVANVVLRTAAITQTDGALRNQNWNDHIEDTTAFQGHLPHITAAIREKTPATWKSGVEGSSTIDTGPTPDDVFVAVTGGVVMQMHDQDFPAIDLQAGGDIHVVNDSVSPYKTITNLNGETLDANGASLTNSSFSFVVWGIANKSGEASHIMLNLPTDSYAFVSPQDAVDDADNFSVYTIPAQFQGVGFLIARFTYTLNSAGTGWTLFDTEDLRGFLPNTAAGGGGGGGGGGGATTFLGLTDTPSAYTDQELKHVRVNAGTTALEFVDPPVSTTPITVVTTNTLTEGGTHQFLAGTAATFNLGTGNYHAIRNINGGTMQFDIDSGEVGTVTIHRNDGTAFTLGQSVITSGLAGERLVFQRYNGDWYLDIEGATVTGV